MDGTVREEIDRRRVADQVAEKVWQIPASEGSGPVVMSLRIPDVTITDSQGRFIVISPKQTAIVCNRLECINDWLQDGED
jgi:hypothetical protein